MMPKESREILNVSIQVLSKLAKGSFFMAKGLFFNESLKKLVFNNIYSEKKKLTYFLAPEYIYTIFIKIRPHVLRIFLGTVYRS